MVKIHRRMKTAVPQTSTFTLLGFFGHNHVIRSSVNVDVDLGESQSLTAVLTPAEGGALKHMK